MDDRFGYDQGVFGSLVTNPDFLKVIGNPSPGFLGIIVACYNIGCFLGCALNFYFGPKYGRREAILLAMVFISVGAVLQCSTYGVSGHRRSSCPLKAGSPRLTQNVLGSTTHGRSYHHRRWCWDRHLHRSHVVSVVDCPSPPAVTNDLLTQQTL